MTSGVRRCGGGEDPGTATRAFPRCASCREWLVEFEIGRGTRVRKSRRSAVPAEQGVLASGLSDLACGRRQGSRGWPAFATPGGAPLPGTVVCKYHWRTILTGPSSNGRTADFGSVNGGSNPPGPMALSSPWANLVDQFLSLIGRRNANEPSSPGPGPRRLKPSLRDPRVGLHLLAPPGAPSLIWCYRPRNARPKIPKRT